MKNALLLASALLLSQTVFAAGYEKSIMFGGQTSGVAGIATPYIEGSQALYFNPAGLISDSSKMDVSVNLSPTMSSFKAPLADPSVQETSNSHLSVPFSVMYGMNINDKLGWGVGVFTSGGNYSDFNNYSIPGIAGTFEAKTDLSIVEGSVGVGYKVMDNLKVGVAYRVLMANANLSKFQQIGAGQFAEVELKDLKQTNFTGFKVGAEYKLSDKTSLGFLYRSKVDFSAKGTEVTTLHTTGSVTQLSSNDVTAGTTFPDSWTLGIKHACTENWNSYLEYNYTAYSEVDNISTESAGKSTPIVLKMHDQHLLRIAGEYKGWGVPFRFGYIIGTQVTNSGYALPTATAPGPAHVVTVGTGFDVHGLKLDGGIEYDVVKGTASGNTAENDTNSFALHLGAGYAF